MDPNTTHSDLYDLPHGQPHAQSHITFANDYEKEKEESTLDDILIRIGQFGPFQLIILLLICMAMLFSAIFSITYVFTASSVVHRCKIPECDSASSNYEENWTQFTIPKKNNGLDQCNRFVGNYTQNQVSQNESLGFCYAHNFDSTQKERCSDNNFIYRDKEVTIANEFNIYCEDEWKLTLVGTIGNVGQFVGIPLGGFISDRYGRRTALAYGGFFSALLGLLRSFTPSYASFLIFEFLDNIASSPMYSVCFILGIELVGPKRRVMACSLITIFYAIGEVALGLVAKYYQNWRVILRIVYIPAIVFITYIWILPESIRWLMSQAKEEDAKNILQRAARVNKRKLSNGSLDKLILSNRVKLATATGGRFPIIESFKKLTWRIINCSFCWIIVVLVYYGISLNAVLLDGNKYNNFIFIALIEIPGFFLPLIIMPRFGRRYSLCGTMLLSGLCCLITTFLPSDQFVWRLILFLIGKLMITAAFQVLYFFTSEIFPTNVRNSLLSFCSMVGRVGSMLAPQTPLLAKYDESAPAILFAICAITSGILSLFFPETTDVILPTTVHDAHIIGTKPPKNKTEVNANENS
ncbi:PREDICTED: solute carrier family 22 member 4-like [Bactrocera latifrons]|uniref:Solute carrier family 22 member 4 n=1 Tax=Bactrocera latifrons TaxID=174628 RepID=A0A0K8UFN6_BACLA|nr:PREDICTED: solute carrier family 22 member 4-like [Bactrocera latifrons]